MIINRRHLFAAFAGAAVATAAGVVKAAPNLDRRPIEAAALGLRPNSADDQTIILQRAITRAAAERAVLQLPAGTYHAGGLELPPFAAIAGVPGATRLVMAGGASLLAAAGGEHITLVDLVFDGAGLPLPDRRGLIHVTRASFLRIAGCEIANAGRNGIMLEASSGEITGNTVDAADIAIFSIDAAGLRIAGNHVRGAGNGGILVWRNAPGDDGTLVIDNRIENIRNRSGGSGQYGNAVNVFRADSVMVRGNRIRGAAFSAVRGNKAADLAIAGNNCSDIGEVALYAELGCTGTVIAGNVVDGAALGVSVTNFDLGGRLAVVQGNLIRNLKPRRPAGTDPGDTAGIGIGIEADAAVTGNVIDAAPYIGIQIGWGPYLRDVAVSGNLVRGGEFGIAVSVAPGAGAASITGNTISGTSTGAVVGLEWKKPVTGDLSKEGAERFPQLTVSGNRGG